MGMGTGTSAASTTAAGPGVVGPVVTPGRQATGIRPRTGWRSAWARVAVVAALAGAVRVPFVWRSLSPDEGGLLHVAAQWSPGTSLYGDYFVDRPPVLIAIFALADALGGTPALRTLGIVAAVATVLLAACLGRVAATAPQAPVLAALTAAVFVSTPLFSTVVNAELLALPFVLAGTVALVAAVRATAPVPAVAWAVLAGAAGAGGALVKQSVVDLFVIAAVLLLVQRRLRLLPAVAGGALAAVAVAVGAAYLRGTDPLDLWNAVIGFRLEAAAVIVDGAPASTPNRLGGVLLALLGSGAPVLAVVLGLRLREPARSVPDLRWPALAVLACELAVVLLGGSYWLHYLMGLVPGLVLITVAATQRPLGRSRLVPAAYAFAVLSTVCVTGWVLATPIPRSSEPAVAWLDEHTRPGDTAVVAFGAPNILRESGLRSPYPELWSMTVRVRDADLADFTAVLESADRPTWVVVSGVSVSTWGVEATEAKQVLRERYDKVDATGGWTFWRVDAS